MHVLSGRWGWDWECELRKRAFLYLLYFGIAEHMLSIVLAMAFVNALNEACRDSDVFRMFARGHGYLATVKVQNAFRQGAAANFVAIAVSSSHLFHNFLHFCTDVSVRGARWSVSSTLERGSLLSFGSCWGCIASEYTRRLLICYTVTPPASTTGAGTKASDQILSNIDTRAHQHCISYQHQGSPILCASRHQPSNSKSAGL